MYFFQSELWNPVLHLGYMSVQTHHAANTQQLLWQVATILETAALNSSCLFPCSSSFSQQLHTFLYVSNLTSIQAHLASFPLNCCREAYISHTVYTHCTHVTCIYMLSACITYIEIHIYLCDWYGPRRWPTICKAGLTIFCCVIRLIVSTFSYGASG